MKKQKVLLPTKRYFNAPEEEINTLLELYNNEVLMRENEKNIVLDVAQLYQEERNESVKYKISGKLKMVFNNDYVGNSEYVYLKNNLYLTDDGSTNNFDGYLPYNEYAFLRTDILREINSPQSGDTITNFVQNIGLTTQYTGHTTITDIDAPYQNWNIYLSYVYSGDTNYPMTYTLSGNTQYDFVSGDGIPFRVSSNDEYYILTSPVEHGMVVGEYIVLSGSNLNNSVSLENRTFYIDSVGDNVYRSEKFVINILKKQLKNGLTLTNNIVYFGKRCLSIKNITGSTSEYYVHKHKTITDINDYILDKIGFESPIWRDERKIIYENFSGENDYLVEKNKMESLYYDFKKPFYLTGITNNFGYTPTEIYTTVIFRNGNGYFDYPVKVGWKFNFHDTWIDNHFSGTKSNETNISYTAFTKTQNNETYTFKSGSTLDKGTILTGAFVEYSPSEMRERVISEAFHKLTIPVSIFDHNQDDPTYYSGASENNLVGLYYQPHYSVKLRQLSPYIETSKTNDVINLPENTKYFEEDGLWKWRDLYEHGYIDGDGFGTDFPFANNIHYVNKNINFYLRNEKNYTNKADGIKSFLIRTIDC
jgi:hypothetical protein